MDYLFSKASPWVRVRVRVSNSNINVTSTTLDNYYIHLFINLSLLMNLVHKSVTCILEQVRLANITGKFIMLLKCMMLPTCQAAK